MKVGGGALFFSTDPKCLWRNSHRWAAGRVGFSVGPNCPFIDNVMIANQFVTAVSETAVFVARRSLCR